MEWDSDEMPGDNNNSHEEETNDVVVMDGDESDDQQASPSSSTSSIFLRQLVAQRTAFVQVKREELTDDITDIAIDDPDGHLCVVCMDSERSCLYVPCNHLAVCAECDADIMAASLPCPMCNTAIDREESVVAGGVVVV